MCHGEGERGRIVRRRSLSRLSPSVDSLESTSAWTRHVVHSLCMGNLYGGCPWLCLSISYRTRWSGELWGLCEPGITIVL
jgi:hypothetical protein